MTHRTFSLALSLVTCLVALVGISLVLGSPAIAKSSTLYVAPSGDCGGASPCYPTIQAAVDDAVDGDTVKVAQGVYTGAGFQVVYIDKAITVTGGYTITDWIHSSPFIHPTVIDAQTVPRRRGVYVDGSSVATTTLEGLVIKRGYAEDSDGGGVYIVDSNVVLRYSQILSNRTTGGGAHGAGLYAQGSSIVLDGNSFMGNSTTVSIWTRAYGGGIYLTGSNASLNDNDFQNNTSTEGGAVYTENSTATLTDVDVENNSAVGGGGIRARYSDVTVNGGVFEANVARGGAGMSIQAGRVIVSGSSFHANVGDSGSGGGLVAGGTVITLTGNSFQENSAYEQGGGIYIVESVATLTENLVQDNTSSSDGGGICVSEGTATLHGNRIRNNTALGNGGGIAFRSNDTIASLSNNRLEGNSAEDNGGGLAVDLYQNRGTISLCGNIILNNTAGTYGGGIALSNGHINAQNDILAGNVSDSEGVYISGGTLSAHHWTVVNNGDYAITANGGSAAFTNTVVSGHMAGGLAGFGIIADYTLFFNTGTPCGSGATCTNNRFGDPHFLNPATDNYHLGPWSAAVDQGVDAAIILDFEGDPRPMRLGFDLGADEQSELPTASFLSSTPDWLRQTTFFTDTTYSFGSTTRQWSFGDGTMSILENPTHTYASPGVWTVVLTETNAAGQDVISNAVIVYGPPTADFTAHPTSGARPLNVTFVNTSTTVPPGDPTRVYFWQLGDGEMSVSGNPTHIYDQVGFYTVTLVVSNAAGSDVITRPNYITVYEPVAANFTANPTTGIAPLEVTFINESCGDFVDTLWDFGDNTTSTITSPTHQYTTPGVYTVSLTVNGPGGEHIMTKPAYIVVSGHFPVYLPIVLRESR